MSFDREQFAQLAADKAKEGTSANRQHLQMLHQAGVKAEALTGDPAWDTFLSYVQAAIQKYTEQRDRITADLLNPALINSDQVALRRVGAFRLNERIEILQEIIGWPAMIKKNALSAADALKTLTDEEGAGA